MDGVDRDWEAFAKTWLMHMFPPSCFWSLFWVRKLLYLAANPIQCINTPSFSEFWAVPILFLQAQFLLHDQRLDFRLSVIWEICLGNGEWRWSLAESRQIITVTLRRQQFSFSWVLGRGCGQCMKKDKIIWLRFENCTQSTSL